MKWWLKFHFNLKEIACAYKQGHFQASYQCFVTILLCWWYWERCSCGLTVASSSNSNVVCVGGNVVWWCLGWGLTPGGMCLYWDHISKNVPGQEFNGPNHCHFTSAESSTITSRCGRYVCLSFCLKMWSKILLLCCTPLWAKTKHEIISGVSSWVYSYFFLCFGKYCIWVFHQCQALYLVVHMLTL